jgi:hypothetical protein
MKVAGVAHIPVAADPEEPAARLGNVIATLAIDDKAATGMFATHRERLPAAHPVQASPPMIRTAEFLKSLPRDSQRDAHS